MYCFVQFLILISLFGEIHNAPIGISNLKETNSFKLVKLAYKLFEPKKEIQGSSPIIFLHGVTSSKEYWGPIPQTVADVTGRKVYAIDARNHGDTAWSNDFNFDINVLDFELFMNDTKVPKAILVGHSMGGTTAMKTALKWPQRVEKLVIEDISTKGLSQKTLDVIEIFLNLCQKALKVIPPGTPIDSAQKMVMDVIIKNLPDSVKAYIKPTKGFIVPIKQNPDKSYSYKTNFKVLIEKLKDADEVHSKITEGFYKGPAYFIYGEKSPMEIWNDKELIKAFFLKATFTGVKKTSHRIHIERPAKFTKLLLRFIRENESLNHI